MTCPAFRNEIYITRSLHLQGWLDWEEKALMEGHAERAQLGFESFRCTFHVPALLLRMNETAL